MELENHMVLVYTLQPKGLKLEEKKKNSTDDLGIGEAVGFGFNSLNICLTLNMDSCWKINI